MAKMVQKTQGGPVESLIYQCYCGEDSYLTISHFDWEDTDIAEDDYYVTVTMHPTSWKRRLKLAWKSIRGLEFSGSNDLLLTKEQITDLSNELKEYLAPKALR